MNPNGPLLICSRPFPPKLGGSSILSRNLWGAWPAGDLVVLSQMNPDENVDQKLALKDVRLEYIPPWMPRYPRLKVILEPLMAFMVKRQVVALARTCKPRAIWANWPSTGFLLGAWLAAKKLGLPLYVHMHDMWDDKITNHYDFGVGMAARLFQRRILRDARKVFAITDEAAEHFRREFQIEPYVLKHCIPDADLAGASREPASSSGRPYIHFAGYIYPPMNQDAVFRLVQALALCKSDVHFEAFVLNKEVFENAGISSERLTVRKGSKADVMAAQRGAKLLYLPLAFNSSNPTEIRTVFPTKLLEYYVSGRAILVHAPKESWASRSAREQGWGLVVDQPDAAALARAIDELMGDEAKQRELVASGAREAQSRAASVVASGLRQELDRLERGA